MSTKTLLMSLICLAAACGSSREPAGGLDGGAEDAGPTCVPVEATAEVDLLLVIDNSIDMHEEQAKVAEQLPTLLEALVERGLHVHAGVVTTDMGTRGHEVPSCEDPDFGDDGVLRTEGNMAISGCAATYPSFVSVSPAGGDPVTIAHDLGCVAHRGPAGDGCGIEQPLEAMLKAVTPSTSPIRFHEDTTGHGDGANAGFLRDDSVLAVLVLTKEPDCSVRDPALFDPESDEYAAGLDYRCFGFPEALHPAERYADGLLALRPNGARLALTAIAGVPPDIAGSDYDAMLADERMQARWDEENNRLAHTCSIAGGGGLAFPPHRIARVAQQLEGAGAATSLQSVCAADRTGAIDALLATIDEARAATTCE